MRITITRAGRWHVDGKDQRRDARRLGTLQSVFHKATVFEYVELKPDCLLALRRYLFNRTHRHRRQTEWNPLVRRGPGCLHFTAARIHSAQAYGAEDNRHRQGFAKQSGFKTHVIDIFQDALAQTDIGQVRTVGTQRVLCIRAAVNVIK